MDLPRQQSAPGVGHRGQVCILKFVIGAGGFFLGYIVSSKKRAAKKKRKTNGYIFLHLLFICDANPFSSYTYIKAAAKEEKEKCV